MIAIMFTHLQDLLPADAIRRRRCVQGEWTFHRGDPVRSVHFVLEGFVELLRHAADGKPVILQRAGNGDMLAEASAFASHYHCDGIAATAALLAEIDRADFLALISNHDFAANCMASMANEIRSTRLRAEILSLKTVAERLDAWLTFNDDGLPAKGGRIALARELGVSPEALYREIAQRNS